MGFHHVIVGVDGRPTGRDAIGLARQLTARDTHLGLAHVYERTLSGLGAYAIGAADTTVDRENAVTMLEDERRATGGHGELICRASLSVGRGLHHIAEHAQADLLVVGSCHRGVVGRVMAGDDTRAVLHGAPCAVAIAPLGYAETAASITTIGVGHSETPDSDAALAMARDLAAEHGASLRALEVVEMPNAPYGFGAGIVLVDVLRDMLAAAKARMAALEGVDGDAVVGLAGEELAAFSGQVDLLVVGSRGYGPLRSLILGSTSAHLVRHARCPLLVLPRSPAA